MPGLDVAFLVIVTTVRLSPVDCTVLICQSVLVTIFKSEVSVTHLLAFAHLASQSGPAWHVICAGFDNPASGPPPPAQLQAPKRTHAISEFRRTYRIAIPTLGQNFRPRPPRCENFTRPPWSDCGSTAAGFRLVDHRTSLWQATQAQAATFLAR